VGQGQACGGEDQRKEPPRHAVVLGFVPLPRVFWPFLAVILMGYAVLTQVMKAHLSRGGSRPVPGGLTQK
jgi:hypothetical protein